jgi:membrane-bound ClpP family serine protease
MARLSRSAVVLLLVAALLLCLGLAVVAYVLAVTGLVTLIAAVALDVSRRDWINQYLSAKTHQRR